MEKINADDRNQMYTIVSSKRQKELLTVEKHAVSGFRGHVSELSSALGMLRLGDQLGWRSLVLIHSKKTIRKYEEILGITVREFFPETGPMAERHLGYVLACRFSNFWKVVSGEEKVEGRQLIQ